MGPSRGSASALAPPPGVSARFWALVLAEPLAGASVLDVGTGGGRVALALAPACGRVVGVDSDGSSIAEARRVAAAAGLANAEFVVADADTVDYTALAGGSPDLVVAHLFLSRALIESAGRALRPGGALVCVGFHVDQWRETGRRSRFAYDEEQARRELGAAGLTVEHLEVEREVTEFRSVEEGLAAAIGLRERWKSDGRWFHYIKFLEDGGRTLTRSHLVVKARRP